MWRDTGDNCPSDPAQPSRDTPERRQRTQFSRDGKHRVRAPKARQTAVLAHRRPDRIEVNERRLPVLARSGDILDDVPQLPDECDLTQFRCHRISAGTVHFGPFPFHCKPHVTENAKHPRNTLASNTRALQTPPASQAARAARSDNEPPQNISISCFFPYGPSLDTVILNPPSSYSENPRTRI